mgnify:CR=1 FL=1
MWQVMKTLMLTEVRELWRRLLRRPEPPSPYLELRRRLEASKDPHDPL